MPDTARSLMAPLRPDSGLRKKPVYNSTKFTWRLVGVYGALENGIDALNVVRYAASLACHEIEQTIR